MTALAARRDVRGMAVALLGLTVVLLASSLVIGLTGGEGWTAELGFIPVAAAFAVVGALVAARTGNRLGWLFLGAGTVSAVTVVANVYAARAAAAELPEAVWAGWTLTVILGIVPLLFFLTLLLFPDGLAALTAVAASGVGGGHLRAGCDGVPGGLRRQLLIELPQAAGSGNACRAAPHC